MRARRDDRGAALLEMAFALPILFLLLFGFLDYGMFVFDRSQTAGAARDGARVAIVHYDQVDVPGSTNNRQVVNAVTSRLSARSPTVTVRCLKPDSTVVTCADAVSTVDRAQVTVAWNRSPITFVGSTFGQLTEISESSAMVVNSK